ncbi:Callisulfakinin [Bienertia sinuspersici]
MFMAFQCFYKRGPHKSSGGGEDVKPKFKSSEIVEVKLNSNWDNITCPVCLDYPHNGVLLQCSSYEKGCRSFVCDTNHLHSNCLERFKTAHGIPAGSNSPSESYAVASENSEPLNPESKSKPTCPLCRGEVNGWVVIEKAREYLDQKKRCCEEERCSFVGTFMELQKHAQEEHPDSRPSKIDPARQLDWENFQQSSEMVDVLSTIHSEVPHGVVLGDYVIEYGDDDTADEFEDFPGDEGNWWTSCILYQVFDNLRSNRNRRRSRTNDTRRGSRRSSNDTSNSDDGSVTSLEFPDYRVDETDDEFVNSRGPGRSNFNRRRMSKLLDVCLYEQSFLPA